MVVPKDRLQYSAIRSVAPATGSTDSHVMPGCGAMAVRIDVTLCMRLPWVSTTPRGRPREPGV